MRRDTRSLYVTREPDLRTATVIVPPSNSVAYALDTARDALYVGLREGVRTTILRVPYEKPEQAARLEVPANEPSALVADACANWTEFW